MVTGGSVGGRPVVGDKARHSAGSGDLTIACECLSALRLRFVDRSLAQESRAGRRHCRPYVGHASSWDSCEIRGDLEKRDACAIYRKNGKTIAAATIGRDRLSLRIEAALEQGDQAALESILREQ